MHVAGLMWVSFVASQRHSRRSCQSSLPPSGPSDASFQPRGSFAGCDADVEEVLHRRVPLGARVLFPSMGQGEGHELELGGRLAMQTQVQ